MKRVRLRELGFVVGQYRPGEKNATVAQGTIQFMLEQNPDIVTTTRTVNTIVGECNDGYLNEIRALHVTPEHAMQAIRQASTEETDEGTVGAGTGMSCLGYKGGVGTSYG